MIRLRALDASVTRKGSVVSLIIGIIGTLVMDSGMGLVMTDIGSFLGNQTTILVVGIAIGLVGMVSVALAYPFYNLITKKERNRIAPEILRLTEELMK